jgi:3-deoxy-D-manno-octulosonate 8-phosphate phosphatase (KDO 8-P phosphatase)
VDGVVTLAANGLPARETLFRATRLRLVITDVDGVLTDGGVYYSSKGEACKRFTVRDGMGVERLREDGVETAFLTREHSPIVARRAEKLRLRLVYLGVADKLAALPALLAEAGVETAHAAYIGDDVNDLGVMRAVAERGLVAAPADAMPAVAALVHLRCPSSGGHGAFRDFAEWILALRNQARTPHEGDAPSPSSSGGSDGPAQ